MSVPERQNYTLYYMYNYPYETESVFDGNLIEYLANKRGWQSNLCHYYNPCNQTNNCEVCIERHIYSIEDKKNSNYQKFKQSDPTLEEGQTSQRCIVRSNVTTYPMLLMSGLRDDNTSINATYQITAIERNKDRLTECRPDYVLF